MRTTLDIADDVLFAAKEVAQRERRTVGDVVSTWARSTLLSPPSNSAVLAQSPLARYGIHPLPPRGDGVVTNELVQRIRDEEGI